MSTQSFGSQGGGINPDWMLAAIGVCVRGRRRHQGWSQCELGRRARLSTSEIQHVEHARRDCCIGTLLRICEAFGITILELFAEAHRRVIDWERQRR